MGVLLLLIPSLFLLASVGGGRTAPSLPPPPPPPPPAGGSGGHDNSDNAMDEEDGAAGGGAGGHTASKKRKSTSKSSKNDDDEDYVDEDKGDYDCDDRQDCPQFARDKRMNRLQEVAFEAVKTFWLVAVTAMVENGEIFLPWGHFFTIGAFVLSMLPSLGDSTDSKIYFHLDLSKVGHSWNGRIRSSFYKARDKILTLFNLDRQSKEDHKTLVKTALQFCKQFCKITPATIVAMTIQDAINLEGHWLPFGTCIFLYTLAYSAIECTKLGGGISIKGYLRRLLLFGVETGVQAFAIVTLGIALTGDLHEWLRGDLSWVIESHLNCAMAADGFFKALQQKLKIGVDPRAFAAGIPKGVSFLSYLQSASITMVAMSTSSLTANWGQQEIIEFCEKNKARLEKKVDHKAAAWIKKNLVSKILDPLVIGELGAVHQDIKALRRRIGAIVPFLPFTKSERKVVADVALAERFSLYREPCVLKGPEEKRRSFGNLKLRSTRAFAAYAAKSYDPMQGAFVMLSLAQKADGKFQMMHLHDQLGLTPGQKERICSPSAPADASDEPNFWVHYDKDSEEIGITQARPPDDDDHSQCSAGELGECNVDDGGGDVVVAAGSPSYIEPNDAMNTMPMRPGAADDAF